MPVKRKKSAKRRKSAANTADSRLPSTYEKNTTNKGDFGIQIDRFVTQVESLAKAMKMTQSTVAEASRKAITSFTHFLKQRGAKTSGKGEATSVSLKTGDLASFTRNLKDLTGALLAVRNVPRIFFCSLVHEYDAFLGRILQTAFYARPDLLNASQKQLSFADLIAFPSLEAAREAILGKEIEAVIRDSHVAQIQWMERRFGLELRKDIPAWCTFVELTERRNLFVHCGGSVSAQYLSVCREQGVAIDPMMKLGDELDVSQEYFEKAVDCILEIGVKLSHVLWRKLKPDALKEADKSLHLTAYEFLVDERYALAKVLLLFAVNTLKKHSSDEIRRMNLINLAIAYYFTGEKKTAREVISSQDWSASRDKFQLAAAILCDRYKDASAIMKRIGTNGEVTREAYASWPLFRKFRQSRYFSVTYRSMFGEKYIVPEIGVASAYPEPPQDN